MKIISIYLFFFISIITFAQSKVTIHNNLNIEIDSLERKKITNIISEFILAKNVANEDLKNINPQKKLETWLFLNNLRELQNSKGFTDKNTLMYEISSMESIKNNSFIIQLNCFFEENKTKILIAKIQILVEEINKQYLLSSTFSRNIKNWKSKTYNGYTFYFENNLEDTKLKNFLSKNNKLNSILKEKDLPTKVYCVSGFLNAYKLLGIDYTTNTSKDNWLLGIDLVKDDVQNSFIVATKYGKLDDFYFGSLWKARVTQKYPLGNLYSPVLEGYSYVNDGNPFYNWEQVWIYFKNRYPKDEKINWLSLYGTKENFSLPSSPLYIENLINGLIIKKLKKKKGFDSVLELLNCGKFNPNNQENYFKVLEKTSAITKMNFNEEIDKLIKLENLNLIRN